MIRTAVYVAGEAAPEAEEGAKPRRRQSQRDGYTEKLVKYVPAEVTSIFAPLAAAADAVGNWLLVIVVIVGFAATPGYLIGRASRLPAEKRPYWFFYALATIAFAFWAIGVSGGVRDLIDIGDKASEVLLGLAALVIPGLDGVLTRFLPNAKRF